MTDDSSGGAADAIREICEGLRARLPAIVDDLKGLAHEEPWLGLPPEDHLHALPELILGLVEAAICEPRDLQARRQCVHAAAEHGVVRRAQRMEQDVVFVEYHLLRRVLWRHIATPSRDPKHVTLAILRIDAAISVATRASLLGYHRAELEERGEWPRRIAALVDEPEFTFAARAQPTIAPRR